jgi:hypothetical protein
LTIAFVNAPCPARAAWASSGKKIANDPRGTLSHDAGASSKNTMSFVSSNGPAGAVHAASGVQPISSSPCRVYWMSM